MLPDGERSSRADFLTESCRGACAARVPLTVVLILCVVVTTLATALVSAQTRASGPYKITLTTTNFSQPLQATAADLNDPAHALFNLQNGTSFWYSVSVQSTPAGITPVPADPSDLFTTTLHGISPLLPPASALPHRARRPLASAMGMNRPPSAGGTLFLIFVLICAIF